MLRDDHLDYKLFYFCPDSGAENAVTAVSEWCSIFDVPKMLMSNGPTYFKNETLLLVWKDLKVPHHCTLAYWRRSSGAVERLGREVISSLSATLSELRMNRKEWTDLIPIVQSAPNYSTTLQRGNICPVTAVMGRNPAPLLKTFIRFESAKPITLSDLQIENALTVKKPFQAA